ncbi:aconitate hydratase AcnA [Kordiimonas pumila]|uniref:Aconitate hydratase A n=1 Tax=Kordiimonas pumila TaxID=2161677 RepID=A0ABV7D893_9PROT|nr:aconitate hydratase AcnA [Kordiimonas pumila]
MLEAQILSLPLSLGSKLERMPWIHRILAENLLRHASINEDASVAAQRWLVEGHTDVDLPFYPARIMMHDTTCGPALVDLAALRSTIAEQGGDPETINPVLRVDVSTDHSLAIDYFGTPDALQQNMAAEMRRNSERFSFMKWASRTFENMHVYPPGTGIMHTINLEQLASVVQEGVWHGSKWCFPDTLIGTDSHTPMVNGIGVLAWGVGGLEAESVMLDMPVMLRVPEVVGVYLSGYLNEGVTATDLALTITKLLRDTAVNSRFVEFFGPGVSSLTAGERSVVANMAPEYGGATGYFPVDEKTIKYLQSTGRDQSHIVMVEDYTKRQKLWFDPEATPDYDEVTALDLCTVQASVAGPHRPQDLHPLSSASEILPLTSKKGERAKWPQKPIVLSAITSCTNTSDPRLLVMAGLVAKKAHKLGLSLPKWMKTSFAPGSPATAMYLERAGVLSDLNALGFGITGYGCTVCIGNSGPLTEMSASAIDAGEIEPVAVLSGNRNFSGRVHRQIENSFLVSPPLVIAYALAADFSVNLTKGPISHTPEGKPVYLYDIWPSAAEIDAALTKASHPADYSKAFKTAEASIEWRTLKTPKGVQYPWDEASTYIRRPPFAAYGNKPRIGTYTAYPLLVVGNDITTDHISPAGTIAPTSDAAMWLQEYGEDIADLNVYSARRGNWEVMIRGLFNNRSVVNMLAETIPAGQTVHAPSGELMPLWLAADRYRQGGDSVVIVAGERYGMGSSRDWAAKGVYLLGVRAVLALSFERIHRSNLINMGIIPLILPVELAPANMKLCSSDTISVGAAEANLTTHADIECRIISQSKGERIFFARAAIETQAEVETLKMGGMLPRLISEKLSK